MKTKGNFCHVICKISNFNMRTAKHLAQASCTDLTLSVNSAPRSFSHGHTKNGLSFAGVAAAYPS